jgi:hypothetical protein
MVRGKEGAGEKWGEGVGSFLLPRVDELHGGGLGGMTGGPGSTVAVAAGRTRSGTLGQGARLGCVLAPGLRGRHARAGPRRGARAPGPRWPGLAARRSGGGGPGVGEGEKRVKPAEAERRGLVWFSFFYFFSLSTCFQT